MSFFFRSKNNVYYLSENYCSENNDNLLSVLFFD